jgi:hypothetical protein
MQTMRFYCYLWHVFCPLKAKIRVRIPVSLPKAAATPARLGSLSVEFQFAVDDVRHVSAFDQELHHLFPASRHLRPSRRRFGVLLQPANLSAVTDEVHLPQALFARRPNGKAPPLQGNRCGILDHYLAPDFDQRFLERWTHFRRELYAGRE